MSVNHKDPGETIKNFISLQVANGNPNKGMLENAMQYVFEIDKKDDFLEYYLHSAQPQPSIERESNEYGASYDQC